MAPKYNVNHVAKDYPFMTCLVKVNTRSSWQKTVTRVLNKCHGIYSFRMDNGGLVEISGTVDPNLLLKMLGKAASKAELCWLQFGGCSSNLFMPINHNDIGGYGGQSQSYYYGGISHPQDGRYLHASNLPRPKLPSKGLRSSSHDKNHFYQIAYDHKHDYDNQYAHNHNHHYQLSYDNNNHDYRIAYDQKNDYQHGCGDVYDCQHYDHKYDHEYYVHDYEYNYEDQTHYRPPLPRNEGDEDMGCCRVM